MISFDSESSGQEALVSEKDTGVAVAQFQLGIPGEMQVVRIRFQILGTHAEGMRDHLTHPDDLTIEDMLNSDEPTKYINNI